MEVIQQEQTLPIENLDFVDMNTHPSKHGKLLPNSFRAIICGPSGCGKTNVILSMLFNPNGAKFKNIYVYSKSLYQPKYQLLKEVLEQVKEVGYFPFNDTEEIIGPNEAKPNSIFIFDDVACDKQQKIQEYYSMGRHKDIDVAYLCQTYSKIPKQLIRDNVNLIVLFKQDMMNLQHAYEGHVSPDMSLKDFTDLCAKCWNEKFGFLVIVKDYPLNDGRYRCGFDKYIRL